MSAISQKSISGITSITSPAGTDDQISLHTSNTNEALKIDGAGNLHLNNHVNTTGVTTASNFKTGSSNLHSTGLNVGDTFVHSTGINGSSADIDDFISVGSNIHLGNAGVVTATSFIGDGSDLTNLPAGLGTALSATASSPLNKMYYTNQVLGVPSSVTVDVPASASKAYTQYADIKVESSADLIVAEGDDLIPDILGLADFGTFGGGASAGRIRVNSISNAANDGSPTVQKGLVVTGVCTATSFSGSGASLTNLPAQATIANNADNRVITGGSGVNLNGEANLTFDGNDLTVTGTAPAINFVDTDADDYKIHNVQGLLKITDTTASADRFVINDNGTGYFLSNFQIGSTTTSPGATLHIKTSYPSLKVDSGGHASDAYVRIISGNAQNSRVDFGDSDDDDIGKIDYDHGDNSMRFTTSASERLRIDSSGNVMINRTSASKKFSIKESSTSSGVYFCQTVGGSSHLAGYAVGIGFDPEGYPARNKIAIVAEGVGAGYSKGKLHFLLNDDANSSEASLSDSRMSITDSGDVSMSAPSNYTDPYRLHLRYRASSHATLVIDSRPDALTTKHIRFYYALHGSGGGSELGSVTSSNAGSVNYNTSSDYRRKQNDVVITDGIAKVKNLRPIRFNWIEQPDITEEGFFAHEAQEVVPNSVFGAKDAVDEDGNPDYQVMDHSKLVPLLTASIKDLIAKVETLEAEVAALKGS